MKQLHKYCMIGRNATLTTFHLFVELVNTLPISVNGSVYDTAIVIPLASTPHHT